jgi:hypothetical protein
MFSSAPNQPAVFPVTIKQRPCLGEEETDVYIGSDTNIIDFIQVL